MQLGDVPVTYADTTPLREGPEKVRRVVWTILWGDEIE